MTNLYEAAEQAWDGFMGSELPDDFTEQDVDTYCEDWPFTDGLGPDDEMWNGWTVRELLKQYVERSNS